MASEHSIGLCVHAVYDCLQRPCGPHCHFPNALNTPLPLRPDCCCNRAALESESQTFSQRGVPPHAPAARMRQEKSESQTFSCGTHFLCPTYIYTLFLEESLLVLPLPFLTMYVWSVRLFIFVMAIPISSLSTWLQMNHSFPLKDVY